MFEYINHDTWLHARHPLSKLVWLFCLMIMALCLNSIPELLILFIITFFFGLISKLGNNLKKMMVGLLPFLAFMLLLQTIFIKSGTVLFSILPPDYWVVTDYALYSGTAVILRMYIILLSFNIFLSSTKLNDIINLLTYNLHFSYEYVFMFMTALRFVPVFIQEFNQIKVAQAARGIEVDGSNLFCKFKIYQSTALPLVMTSLRRAERLAIAMETRGYGNGDRTVYKSSHNDLADKSLMLAFVVLTGYVIYRQFIF